MYTFSSKSVTFWLVLGSPPGVGPPNKEICLISGLYGALQHLWSMKGFTRYLHRSRGFLRATEGDFIDVCVVRGMFCIVSEGFYSLFTSFAGVYEELQKAILSIFTSFAACFA